MTDPPYLSGMSRIHIALQNILDEELKVLKASVPDLVASFS